MTCALALGAALGGCSAFSSANRQQMAEANSVLAPIMKRTSPAEAASWAADPYDADKRARGMNLLMNAPWGGEQVYLDLYRQRITDESTPVRAVAARALALHGTPADVERIVPLLKEDQPLVRLEATRALQRLHNPVAVGPLIERLQPDKESEPEIRAEAASALGQYPESRVLQALIAAVADTSLLVNTEALSSLRTLTGNEELGMDRKAWVQWAKETDKPFAHQQPYIYPVFWREKRWIDHIPFMPAVPNEQASTPVGFTMDSAAGTGAAAGAAGGSSVPGPAGAKTGG